MSLLLIHITVLIVRVKIVLILCEDIHTDMFTIYEIMRVFWL